MRDLSVGLAVRLYSSVFLIIIFILPGFSQDKELKKVRNALSTYSAISNKISISKLHYSSSPDSVRYMGGAVTIFGETTGLKVEFISGKRKRLLRIAIELPERTRITTQDFRAIFKEDLNGLMPMGVDAGVAIRSFEIRFDKSRRNKVIGIGTELQFATWMPFKDDDGVTLSDIKAEFFLSGLNSRAIDLKAKLSASFLLHEDLAKKIGIGQTKFKAIGSIDTGSRRFSIGADISSRGIPIIPDRSILLNRAGIELAFEGGKPKLILNGKITAQNNNKPIMPSLNGKISIDLSGKLYGEAWMSKGKEWRNPLGLSNNIALTKMGYGFGINFMTSPIPTPVVAIEGGLRVYDTNGRFRFGGNATVGVDFGNPTSSVLDAEIEKAKLSDVVDAFSGFGTPGGFANELRKIGFYSLHLTLTPPGPGVNLFGIDYKPGFFAKGAFNYGKNRGAMLIDISEDGVEGYGSITPIRYKGFSLTGIGNNKGPNMYLVLRPTLTDLAFALRGKLNVLDISAHTNIYLSNAGFNVTLEGKVFNEFQAILDIAGTDITKGGGLYVKAALKDDDNLLQKISEEASAELKRLANNVKRDYDAANIKINTLKPQLAKADKDLKAKQNAVRAKWQKGCSVLNQRKAQDAERQRKQSIINQLKSEIQRMESLLVRDRFKSAKYLNPTVCPPGSKKAGNKCYKPRSGYKWVALSIINSNKATFKPEVKKIVAIKTHGKFNLLKGGCPSGQFGDAITGKCYSCPPGSKKLGAQTKCVKTTPKDFKPAREILNVGCGRGGSFPDLVTRKCWKCPQNYSRKISTYPVNSSKACELNNLGQRQASIRQKKVSLTKLELELNIITKGIGELGTKLSGIASNVCQNVKNTDVINADPAVAPYFTKRSSLSLTVKELNKTIKTIGTTQVGALKAASWMVNQGGQAMRVVDIDKASFEGCLSTVSNGRVKLMVKGSFSGNPLNASLDINVKNPGPDIEKFAQKLLRYSNPQSTFSNGSCKRPNVPRPIVSSDDIEALMKFVNKGNENILAPRPKREKRPAWASEPPSMK